MRNFIVALTAWLAIETATADPINNLTDYQCMSDCTSNGYMYQYCRKVCEY